MSDANQRQYPRIPLGVTVCRADDVEPGRYLAVDISSGGICMRSTRKEKVGGFVALSFALDGCDLNLYAEVIWSRSAGSDAGRSAAQTSEASQSVAPYLVGMKWVALSDRASRVIQNYVNRHLPRSDS